MGTCQHPTDGKEYIIAYRDCCGKDVCNRCFCDNNKGQVPIYRPQSEQSQTQLRARLNPAALDEAWAAGQSLSLEQAITYALRRLE